jgi:hypothetical protein
MRYSRLFSSRRLRQLAQFLYSQHGVLLLPHLRGRLGVRRQLFIPVREFQLSLIRCWANLRQMPAVLSPASYCLSAAMVCSSGHVDSSWLSFQKTSTANLTLVRLQQLLGFGSFLWLCLTRQDQSNDKNNNLPTKKSAKSSGQCRVVRLPCAL